MIHKTQLIRNLLQQFCVLVIDSDQDASVVQIQMQQADSQLHISEDPTHDDDMDDVEETSVKPRTTQSGDVPDATQAVEIVTVEQANS